MKVSLGSRSPRPRSFSAETYGISSNSPVFDLFRCQRRRVGSGGYREGTIRPGRAGRQYPEWSV